MSDNQILNIKTNKHMHNVGGFQHFGTNNKYISHMDEHVMWNSRKTPNNIIP